MPTRVTLPSKPTPSTPRADSAKYDFVCALPYVSNIAFVGHSQGGVIAGMLAGRLESSERRPKCIAQLAPAAVLKDDALAGQCMGKKYDAKNPPEYVNVLFHKLGRKFILDGEGHFMNGDKARIAFIVTEFMKSNLL